MMVKELVHYRELLTKVLKREWYFTSDSPKSGCTHWTSFKADGQEFYLYAKENTQFTQEYHNE